jgi:hypothetical protein
MYRAPRVIGPSLLPSVICKQSHSRAVDTYQRHRGNSELPPPLHPSSELEVGFQPTAGRHGLSLDGGGESSISSSSSSCSSLSSPGSEPYGKARSALSMRALLSILPEFNVQESRTCFVQGGYGSLQFLVDQSSRSGNDGTTEDHEPLIRPTPMLRA